MSLRFDRSCLSLALSAAALILSACGGEPADENAQNSAGANAAQTSAEPSPEELAAQREAADAERLAALETELSDIPEEPADEAEADRLGALLIERMLLKHGDSRDVRRLRPLAMATETRVGAGSSYTNYVFLLSRDGFYRLEAITPEAHTLLLSNNNGTFVGAWNAQTGENVYRDRLDPLQGLHPLCELLAPGLGYAMFLGCYRSPAYLRTETFAGETAHRIRFAQRGGGLGEVFLSPDGTPLGDRRLNPEGQVTMERRFTSLREVDGVTLIESFEVFDGERVIAQSTWSQPRRDEMDAALFEIDPETGRAVIPPQPADM